LGKITKKDASDLKSFVDELIRRSLELERAAAAHVQAQRSYERFIHCLQYPAKEAE